MLSSFLSRTDNINYSDLNSVKKYNELDSVKTITNNSNKNSNNNTPRKATQINNTIQTSQLSGGLEVQSQIKVSLFNLLFEGNSTKTVF